MPATHMVPVTTYLIPEDARALAELAKKAERTTAAEARLALKQHIDRVTRGVAQA